MKNIEERAERYANRVVIKVHHTLEKILSKEMLDELIKVLKEE